MKIAISKLGMAVFLCGHELLVDLHWCQREKPTLVSAIVVVVDIVPDDLYQFFAAGKLPAVVNFALNDAPKSLHRPIVDAAAYSRHALRHSCI